MPAPPRCVRGAAGKDDAPRIELAYVVVLAAVAAVLLALTFRTENGEDALARSPDLRITVTASQWRWRFAYPSGRVVQGPSPVLTVPAGQVVEFVLRSRDVVHSMWIPDQRFKRYAYPDRTNRFDLTFGSWGRRPGYARSSAGSTMIRCGSPCTSSHPTTSHGGWRAGNAA